MRSAGDRVLATGVVIGVLVFAAIAVRTDYAYNDWDWLRITRSVPSWASTLTRYETIRLVSQAVMGGSYSLFGPVAWIPAAVFTAVNLLSLPLGARVLQRMGLTRRAAWIASACAVFSLANAEVTHFLASHETAMGRTAVLLVLDQALDDGERPLHRATGCLLAAFLVHDIAVVAAPLTLIALRAQHRDLRAPGAVLFFAVAAALTITRVALHAIAPATTHAFSLSAVPTNLAFWGQSIVRFVFVEHLVLLVALAALVLGARIAPRALGTPAAAALVLAIVALSPYVGAAYRNPYFFSLAAVAVAAPVGWAFDAWLKSLNQRLSTALAVIVTIATVAPLLSMKLPHDVRHLTRTTRQAASEAVARDGGANERCLWLVSASAHAVLRDGDAAHAVIDVAHDGTSNMLALLHPKTRFVVVEVDDEAFSRAETAVGDAVIRFDATLRSELPRSAAATSAGRCKK